MAEGERRSVVDERRYAIVTKESIVMMAESGGHDDIDDTIAGILGEDVSYRLREITQKSAQFMRHARRKRLHTDDFNKACRHSDIQPVHGHGSSETPAPFHHIKTDIGESIHFTDDPELNLANVAVNDYMPKQLGDTTIKVHWLAVEGVQKTAQNPQGNKVEASGTLMKYFDKITQAVLGLDSEMMKTALSDLRTNANISTLLPHFVSFVANGVKTVSHDLRQLSQLLYMIQSLVYNSALFLEAQPFLAQLIQGIEYCLLQPFTDNGSSTCDQWSLKDYAARLLSHVISVWGNSVNHLERFTEKTLRETLYDHNKPYAAHYGAIMGLLYLGSENIERVVLPHLGMYWPYLMSGLNKSRPETSELQHSASMVYGALLLSVEHVLRKYIKQFKDQHLPGKTKTSNDSVCIPQPPKVKGQGLSSSCGFMSMFDKSPVTFYIEMLEYFGDSLTLRLPEILELRRDVFKPAPREIKTFLTDTESQKSGEELLAELEEQVKQEQEEKKLRHQESYLKVKQELELKERSVRYKREHECRQADRRQQLQIAQQRQIISAAGDSDAEIDVEGDNDKSDNSFQSEKSEEDLAADMSLAVKSSIGEPGQGIKLTFTKRPKLTQFSGDSPFSDYGDYREKESKHSRKRKHSSLSPDLDISNYETGPSSFSHLGLYSSEGEGSSDSSVGRKSLTMKFKKKDNYPE
ncbi:TAF6-like RNA polymerase II p300/CBP-associated factor-associated factor 65 kDa subunit 6L [Mercenaria mercenaria]|uniref:TAF6-like RNA polymerase II p300/CBP-associated factor-associated factor 65 kDa subunit 6L n=1 Tax=Mercenaria mercenaria TaxID=6596 RepID=UPI00234E46DE|nr:TAF6-like RNA polymerase II p300/CBP-associated factor-associated factor 65 kDa subunit 6L [Mercenaria mercenaria]XP_053394893.1 TAF6-like RNA polymerase II p300/CBP-associated factor-associated factor 65 kDa subunit 6L [Mercenaria mercenaria]XP_053394903.1 TAF6-like RNA polymerase II p300/CBP-associated factor-associated factor 65 kDa subunit 6L [Mercenaria mercenaria]